MRWRRRKGSSLSNEAEARRAAAAELDVVASRVRRLVPGVPPALQKELHSVARDITVLSKYVAPNRVPSAVKVEISGKRRGRLVNTTQTIKGRRVVVQQRKPFAIFVG
jgi:hypothetical protein